MLALHKIVPLLKLIFTESPTRQIQSISRYVCLSVPSAGTRNHVDWRLLVKERTAKIKKKHNLFL